MPTTHPHGSGVVGGRVADVTAVVTDVHLRSVLAGVRGLGRAGIPVVALAPRWHSAGRVSRYVRASRVGADSVSAPAAFASSVMELCARHAPAVVYPGCEAAIDALLVAAPDDGSLPLAYGDTSGLAHIRDKARLPQLAAAVGLETPRTLVEGTAEELRRDPPVGPCVIKPVRPGGTAPSATRAETAEDVMSLLARLPADEPLLVQERVSGRLRALSLVVDRDGRVAGRFEQIAHRTFPADMGISSRAVSVAPDEGLVSRSAHLLRLAGFSGLAQLQFVDSATGPRLIDVNPRFYGSLPLALAAGANLPAAWHAVATGRPDRAPAPYRVGVTYRWFESDLIAAAKGDVGRAFRRPPRPRVGAVWATDDPLPGLVMGAGRLRHRFGGLARRLRATG